MQRLTEKYRPDTLAGIVGQPSVRILQRFIEEPHRECFMLQGPPGTGKTTAALAVARELGAHDEFSGLQVIVASELGVEDARDLFRRLRLKPMEGASDWHVVILEELEMLSKQCQTFLKVGLERNLPPRAIVLATSNDPTGLQSAVIQRFKPLDFPGSQLLARNANDWVANIWSQETDAELPRGWDTWGWTTGMRGSKHFSVRSALDCMELELLKAEAA